MDIFLLRNTVLQFPIEYHRLSYVLRFENISMVSFYSVQRDISRLSLQVDNVHPLLMIIQKIGLSNFQHSLQYFNKI